MAAPRNVMRTVLLFAVAAVAFALAVQAGPATSYEGHDLSNPQVTDPAGDVKATGGLPAAPPTPLPSPLPRGSPDWSDIDLLQGNVFESPGSVHVLVQTVAPLSATATLAVRFTLDHGPQSVYGSTAHASAFVLKVVNHTLVASPAGSAVVFNGTFTDITVPRASLSASGGDVIANLTLATNRTDNGGTPITQDDQVGTDTAPDPPAVGHPYTLARAPATAGLAVARDGPPLAGRPGVRLDLFVRVSNTGSEPDVVTLAPSWPGVAPVPFTLLPAQERAANLSVEVPADAAGNVTFTVVATGTSGARATLSIPVAVAVPAVVGHHARPGSLSWLTPFAQGVGLVALLGDDAEAFVLALIVLAGLLALFLGLGLQRGPPVPQPTEKPILRPGVAPRAGGRRVLDYGDGLEIEVTGDVGDLLSEPEPRPASPIEVGPAATVRLAEVRHDPATPKPGATVTTTATVQNDTGTAARLAVVLSVEGEELARKVVDVPAQSASAVLLEWKARPGRNPVRVQVVPS
ncbi:MAG: hypothetical protein ACYDBQ_11130 [Thermoplasmatota archaeon]